MPHNSKRCCGIPYPKNAKRQAALKVFSKIGGSALLMRLGDLFSWGIICQSTKSVRECPPEACRLAAVPQQNGFRIAKASETAHHMIP